MIGNQKQCPTIIRREVPEYEQVRREYAGRGVEFIGLTTEDPRTSSNRVKQFARDLKVGFRLGWADHSDECKEFRRRFRSLRVVEPVEFLKLLEESESK